MNLFDLTGKVAIVTGGNGGIGLGIAQGLAQAGAKIVVMGRNAEKSQMAGQWLQAQVGAQVLVVTGDVWRADDVDRAVAEITKHFGRIDILFNNAGINIRKQPEELSLAEWQEVINTNLTSAFLMSKAVYPSMKKGGGGKIVNIGSMTSIFGAPFAPAYASSKGGIVQLTKSLALAWAKDNIQVNSILPGWFDTELTEKAREQIQGLHERGGLEACTVRSTPARRAASRTRKVPTTLTSKLATGSATDVITEPSAARCTTAPIPASAASRARSSRMSPCTRSAAYR